MASTLIRSWAHAGGGVVARQLTAGGARLLMYHRFAGGADPRRLSAGVFAQHLQYLTRHFRVRRLSEVAAAMAERRALEPRTVVVTVDDGYADFVEHAYPLLQRYQVPATLFLVADFVERQAWLWFDAVHWILQTTAAPQLDVVIDGVAVRCELSSRWHRDRAWSAVGELCMRMNGEGRAAVIAHLQRVLGVRLPEATTPPYRAITWAAAAQLDPRLVEFGSHTCTHPVLSRCTPREIERELLESKHVIEARLGRAVDAFAYPHGGPSDYDARAIVAARAAGYRCAAVAHGGLLAADADLFRLQRLSAGVDPRQFRSTVNGLELLANRYRTWRHAAAF